MRRENCQRAAGDGRFRAKPESPFLATILLFQENFEFVVLTEETLGIALLVGRARLRGGLFRDLADVVAQDRDPAGDLLGRQDTEVGHAFISPPPAPAGCGCRPGTKYRLLSDPGEDKIFPDLAHPAIAALLFAQACLSLAFARQTLR